MRGHLSKGDSESVGLGCGVLHFYHSPGVPMLHLFENEGFGMCSSTGGLFGGRQAESGCRVGDIDIWTQVAWIRG